MIDDVIKFLQLFELLHVAYEVTVYIMSLLNNCLFVCITIFTTIAFSIMTVNVTLISESFFIVFLYAIVWTNHGTMVFISPFSFLFFKEVLIQH